MTQLKERAVEMIQRMPEEKMFYVINILQNLEGMATDINTDKEQAIAAFEDIMRYRGRLPADFDADRQLAEAREEKGIMAAHSIPNLFYILRKDFSQKERRALLRNLSGYFASPI